MGIRLFLDHQRMQKIYMLTVLYMVGMSTNTFAQHHFVLPDGRMIPMVKSTNEWGITLSETQDIQTASVTISAQNIGTISDFNNIADSNIKILRVQDSNITQHTLLNADVSIIEAYPVFRFQGHDHPVISTGTVVVKVQRGMSDEKRQSLWSDHGFTEVLQVNGLRDVYRIKPTNPDADEILLAEPLAHDPRTLWAQPNLISPMVQHQLTPSDQFFPNQWHLRNTGQTGGTPGADINIEEAWLLSEGQDILLGMFDDACDVDHKDLRDGYIGTGHDPSLPSIDDGFDDPRPKQINDNHGTSVMGIAAASANSIGVRGVAFQSRFTVSRAFRTISSFEKIASVYTFARQQEVDVHINSWGFTIPILPAIVEDAIKTAFRDGRNKGNLDGDDEDTDDPLGMVIVFSSGNDNKENFAGFDISTLPQVIGVGASTDTDTRASFSNFGNDLNVLAPGILITTTDNEDSSVVDQGFNIGGENIVLGIQDIDPSGSYTGFFGGTSASCPIVAGVAALILAQNPLLSASDVRLLIDHTADRVNPNDANYDGITSHSITYGYGRVNAGKAVTQATNSINIGNRTWPDRPADVRVELGQINWRQNIGTDEFLVLESNSEFEFIPEDGVCYSNDQLGCSGVNLPNNPFPGGVTISNVTVGCALSCSSGQEVECKTGERQCIGFLIPEGKKYFAIYARSATGRYSFGVSADSDGNVFGSGEIIVRLDDEDGGFFPPGDGGGDITPTTRPSVTINASPLNGESPLTVNFRGNAVSAIPIDDSKTFWDFDIRSDSDGDGDKTNDQDANTRTISHKYVVPPGDTRLFIARLTMFDDEGNIGTEDISIRVDGTIIDDGSDALKDDEFQIIVGTPTNPSADRSEGTAPFNVMLNIDANSFSGILQSVSWDLGDGISASSLSVPHTYLNETDFDLRIPITATVTTFTLGGTSVSSATTRLITVHPGGSDVIVGRPTLPGTGTSGAGGVSTPCGMIGLIPIFTMMFSLMLLRRKNF